jgi:hypothetical protein
VVIVMVENYHTTLLTTGLSRTLLSGFIYLALSVTYLKVFEKERKEGGR